MNGMPGNAVTMIDPKLIEHHPFSRLRASAWLVNHGSRPRAGDDPQPTGPEPPS